MRVFYVQPFYIIRKRFQVLYGISIYNVRLFLSAAENFRVKLTKVNVNSKFCKWNHLNYQRKKYAVFELNNSELYKP